MNICLINVKYSPNLGDGLLCVCLESTLGKAFPDGHVYSMDLAGRSAITAGGRRRLTLQVLNAVPSWARRLLAGLGLRALIALKLRAHYAKALASADAVVVGGGNLLSDRDLNFPLKLRCALDEARKRKLPVFVYGVGASLPWSSASQRLFEQMFNQNKPHGVFVRDRLTQRIWDERLAGVSDVNAKLVRDPGLLAGTVWPSGRTPGPRPLAALGVISHVALSYHISTPITADELEDWFVHAAASLVDSGFNVVAFTNGSPEDRLYLEGLKPHLSRISRQVSFTQPATPEELAAVAASADVLIAHRMHAVIAAYAYGTPAISLQWEQKLEEFAASVGREAWHLSVLDADPGQIGALAKKAMAAGVSCGDEIVGLALSDVQLLADTLGRIGRTGYLAHSAAVSTALASD